MIFRNKTYSASRVGPSRSPRVVAAFALSWNLSGFVRTLASAAAVLICTLGIQGRATAATRVPIVIDEPFENRSVAWPVTTGIPFPRGGLVDERQCRLVDDQGVEQPLQSRVAATWDAKRTSIRWLTIDFIAVPDREYALEFGSEIKRASFKSPIEVDEDDFVRVSTGAISADFHARAPSAIGNVRTDLNGDGKIAADEIALAGANDGEHYYVDQEGRRFSSAGDKEERMIVVESEGPVRACVRVDGFYTGPAGKRIVGYRTRYHFFAGLGIVKIIDEFKIVGSTMGTQFKDIGIAFQLPGKVVDRSVSVDTSGDDGNQIGTTAWTRDTTSITATQKTYRHFGNPKCVGTVTRYRSSETDQVEKNDRVGEWMNVTDGRRSVTGSMRWFWQQFPKSWETTGDKLTLHLWSHEAGELDFGADGLRDVFGPAGKKYALDWKGVNGTLSPISNFFYFAGHSALNRGDVDGQGINKHHEFYLHVGGAEEQEHGFEYGRLAAKPPLALATGEWNCSTDVFGPLMPRPNDSKYEAIVDRLFDLGRQAQDDFGDYGWWLFGSGPHYSYQWDEETKRHYADPRRFEYHTYQKETQLWWNYLRSGERKFYDWAFPSENHWVDIAVTHVPLEYQCDWRGGFRQQQTLQFRPGDWSIDSAMHYVRQRDSAEAWLRGGSQFWASYHRTLETTTLAYYLTGDERYNDVLNYWRDYWSDLAGKTSASNDIRPWHREQPWFVPTKEGEPTKTWAEMIRDYAPFTSGLRHQMTQFFNLATLYEHTWDPTIGQVVKECAEAYLDPDHRIGVWRTQENSLPANADAPLLCHFWIPALWKYARATGDPRMDEIFKRYFDAAYAADPFRGDVGVYSNVHLGYAYYFTRDARHLRAAQIELEALLPNAEPLASPKELGQRLYNPYAPIKSLTAVPRLTWALAEAKQNGVAIPPPAPLKPQRSAIALLKKQNRPLKATLWGYDRQFWIIGPDAKNYRAGKVTTKQYSSDIQPFDRQLPNFEVYLHELEIPADALDGFYLLAPKLELAVLAIDGELPLVNAARPIAVDAQESFALQVPSVAKSIQFESAEPTGWQFLDEQGGVIPATVSGNRLTVDTGALKGGRVLTIENQSRGKLWLRIADQAERNCWVSFEGQPPSTIPTREQTLAALPSDRPSSSDETFVAGRFGRAVQIVSERVLRIPDHVVVDEKIVQLFDMRQGTIEFWVKKLWDERLVKTKPVDFLSNGLLRAWNPRELPVGEWTHVAVEWRPLRRDPSRQAVHIYINGRDLQNYRSTWWEGYSQKPLTFPANGKWLKEFLIAAKPESPFAIDELRISNMPRYTDLEIEFGGQQTFNPTVFDPPTNPFHPDEETLLLFRFDGNLAGESPLTKQQFVGQLSE